MQKVIMGNHALSWGAVVSRAQVIPAYPITPQTEVVSFLSELCADKVLDAEFVKVESEHSAMAGAIGASVVGARAFTATSAQGLALMHEMIHWAVGARLPVVLGNINRAMGPPWTIWTDQNDSLSQRDTGILQFYCESVQEILDTVIQAYKVSETVYLPSMVVLDAFVLSHTSENCDIPDVKLVDKYLPPYKLKYKMDWRDPHAFGGLTSPDWYYELRYKIELAMEQAREEIRKADLEFKKMFGRSYGLVETYRCEGAELIIIASSTIAGTARLVVNELRDQGKKVGLLRIRVFRPFPCDEVRKTLKDAKKVCVIDRNISFGHGGIFFQEVKSSMYNTQSRPPIFGFIAGLGGRDVTPDVIKEMVQYTEEHEEPEDKIWIGVKR